MLNSLMYIQAFLELPPWDLYSQRNSLGTTHVYTLLEDGRVTYSITL